MEADWSKPIVSLRYLVHLKTAFVLSIIFGKKYIALIVGNEFYPSQFGLQSYLPIGREV